MDNYQVKEVWNSVKQELLTLVPEHVFYTWITPIEAADFENNTLVLLSPQQMSVNILKTSWSDAIKTATKKLDKFEKNLRICVVFDKNRNENNKEILDKLEEDLKNGI